MTKIIVLLDWSDDQSRMPEKPGCTATAQWIAHNIMKSFKKWSEKQSRPYRLVIWHTHYLNRWVPPWDKSKGQTWCDCPAGDNVLLNRVEAIAKNYDPNRAIIVANDAIEFTDDFDLDTAVESINNPGSIAAALKPSCCTEAFEIQVLSPAMQRHFGNERARMFFGADDPKIMTEAALGILKEPIDPDAVPKIDQYEKDWTEADFLDWTARAQWQETDPRNETATLDFGSKLPDLYKAAMFILRNGEVRWDHRSQDETPLMTYPLENRLYYLEMSYASVGRVLITASTEILQV